MSLLFWSNIAGRIAEVWCKERSVMKLRQMYEAACTLDNGSNEQSVDPKLSSIVSEKVVLDLVGFSFSECIFVVIIYLN